MPYSSVARVAPEKADILHPPCHATFVRDNQKEVENGATVFV